jgi:Na+/proline symporter
MSSISGEIAALSSVSMIDFYKRYFKQKASDIHYLRAGQACTIFWGLFATLAAAYLGRGGTSLVETVNTIGSYFYGPILGVFVLAFLIKRANGHGAFAGVVVGMITVVIVSQKTQIAWLYYNAIGPVVVVFVGTIVSLILPQKALKTPSATG